MVLASAAPAASQVVPGILGFLVVAGMGLILFFLLRSMNKQLRKVVPDPAWRKEASQNQAQAQVEAQEQQGYTTNGTAQT
jgi:Na+-transporting methylmalonyl-CoA/oxaloacetate decarboxylase gamma subunit